MTTDVFHPELTQPELSTAEQELTGSHPDAGPHAVQEQAWDDTPLTAVPHEDAFDTAEHTAVPTRLLPEKIAGNLYGVRLRQAGQIFFFPKNGLDAKVGDKIIIALEQGQVLGEIASVINAEERIVSAAETADGDIVGLAMAEDIAMHTENKILGAEAAAFCKSCIRQHKLDMKLVDVEVLHDRSKIIFFFTAPSRIDFRELVKDLVRHYRTRIELRQIGVRHEAQMIGGLGNCGMVCCCHQYLRKFAPVTIKMAKEQNLFLNPAKLSGMCGRLLCCLSFEQGNYEEFNRSCPKAGKKYQTPYGIIRVGRANLFSQTICGINEANEEVSFTLEEWKEMAPKRHEASPSPKQGEKQAAGTEIKKEREHPSPKQPAKQPPNEPTDT